MGISLWLISHTHTLIKHGQDPHRVKILFTYILLSVPLSIRCVCECQCVCLPANFTIDSVIRTLMTPNTSVHAHRGLDAHVSVHVYPSVLWTAGRRSFVHYLLSLNLSQAGDGERGRMWRKTQRLLSSSAHSSGARVKYCVTVMKRSPEIDADALSVCISVFDTEAPGWFCFISLMKLSWKPLDSFPALRKLI